MGTVMEADEGIYMMVGGGLALPPPNTDLQEHPIKDSGPPSGSASLPLPPGMDSLQPALPNLCGLSLAQ